MSEQTGPAVPVDGNAAAGLMREFFAFDVTTASLTCVGCGMVAEIGAIRVYGEPMGAILRCRQCDTAVVRLVRTPFGFWMDMRGSRSLQLRA
jgi:hypothetical protein